MDSIIGEDPSLPINFEESGRFGGLQNDSTLYPDITADNFSQLFPNSAATGGPAMNSGSGRLSPSRTYTMKELEQQISELKKENFSLKLRIYYMEEKIQQKYEDDDDIKTNIELKVEAESLKKELMDKQHLLGKASQAVESIAQEKEQLLKNHERAQDINLKQMREKYEDKLRDKEEETKNLQEIEEDLQRQLNKAQELQQELEKAVRDKTDEKELASENGKELISEKDKVIDQLESALQTKEELISGLSEEKLQIAEGTLQPLRKDNDKLKKDLGEKEKEVEDLKRDLEEEQRIAEEQLEKQKEGNSKKMKLLEEVLEKSKEELMAKGDDIKNLENDLRSAQRAERESTNGMTLKDQEIQSLKSNSLKRDKAIQGFVQVLRGKEKELERLNQQLDDKDREVSASREAMHKAEMKKYQDLEHYQSSVSDFQTNVADLKNDLYAKQLENEGLQKTNSRKQQEIDRLRNERIQAEADKQKDLGEKDADNKDLHNQVQEARDRASRETRDIKEHYEDLLEDCKKDLDKKDKMIQKLNKTLQDKDGVIQDLMEDARSNLSSLNGQTADTDSALDDLKKRFKEKEKRLEGKVDEQILARDAAEAEAGELRKLLKEKENDLEQLQMTNLDQKQKCKDFENRLKGTGDKNKQLTEALNIQSRSKEVQDDGLKRSLGEKDAIISSLQKSIAEKDGMVDTLRDLLEGQSRGESAKEDIVKQLTTKLRDKEKQLQEMVAERADVANGNEKATQDLLDTLRDKDEQIKDLNTNLGKQAAQHGNKLRALQRELDNKEMGLQEAGDTLNRTEKEQENLVSKLRKALEEKDKTIEKLLDSGREKDKLFVEMQQAGSKNRLSPVKAAEIQRLKDEVEHLRETLSGKEDEVRRLKASLPEKGELDSLIAELENKNKLLERAKATINQLQQPEGSKYEVARQKRRVSELEADLADKQQELNSRAQDDKAKDRLIKELQIRVNLIDSRKRSGSVNDNDLHDALREQIREISRLTDALNAERQLHVNITQSGTNDQSDSSRTRLLDSELASVQALRRQLENGLSSREEIRINIDGRPYVSSNTSGISSDVHESSYIPSSRGQSSRDLQSKEVQTGTLEDETSMASEPHAKRRYVNIMDMTVPEMRGELIDLRNQLDESAKHQQVLEERLGQENMESLRSIPGQEDDSADKNNVALKQKVDSLEAQLQRREREAESLNQQLEAALLNQSRNGAESSSHVVPILKQQLDQAKTLLREKDAALQEKEHECQRMKQRSKGNRDSSSQVNAALQKENESLGQLKKDLIAKVQQKMEKIKDLEEQNGRLKEVNEGLTTTMDELNGEAPHLKSQLEKAKSVIRKRDRENVALREKLGIGPKDEYDSGNTKVDHLEAANAILKEQLQDKTNEVDNVRSELDSANAEISETNQRRPNPELHNLRKKLKTAENMNGLLKRHIALNTPSDGEAGEFNPQLIIDLAREIERLQQALKKAGVEVKQGSGTDCKETQTREVPVSEEDVLSALEEQLAHSRREIKERTRNNLSLQRKLRATEGTVHLQASRIQRYRRQMHNSGLSPASTPKRVRSDSNLLRPGQNFGQQFTTSESESEPLLATDDLLDTSYPEFGQSDDIFELREQVALLKNQNERCRRAMRMLRNSRSNSQSSSPSRSLSPDREKSPWFQVVANQGAFTRMQEEVENLKAQLEQANDLNFTLHEQYRDIQTQIEEAQVIPENQDKVALKAKEKEIILLRGYLEESKRLCDLMKEMLLEALKTMDDIKQIRDWTEGNVGEEVLQRFELAQERLKRGADMADTLHKALDEPSSSSGRSTPRKRSTFAESLKTNLREISSLQKQLGRSKKTNQSLHKLLEENQQVADETRTELEKISGDAREKVKNIAKLQHQLRESLKAKSALERQLERRPTRDVRTSSTQTDATDTTLHDVPDLAELHSKLRENQLLVCTLKSELEVYRNVLHSKTPEGSPHSVKSGYSGKRETTDDTLREYLEELRSLRKKLEDSIKVNDKLRKQLEGKLIGQGEGCGGVTTIHLQEINIQLTTKLETLNVKLVEKDRLNQKLKDDYKQAQRDTSRLELENRKLSEQLQETIQLQNTLRFELSVYEQIHPTDSPGGENAGGRGTSFPKITDPKTGIDLTELLKEMRHLRIQLERSIDTNNALRTKLEELMSDKRWSPNAECKHSHVTLKQTVIENNRSSRSTRLSRRLFVDTDNNDGASKDDFHTDSSPYEDPQFYDIAASNKSPNTKNGAAHSPPSKDTEYYAVGSLLTYERLKKTLGEVRAVLRVFDTLIGEEKGSHAQEKTKLNTVHQLRSLISKASILIEESNVHLVKFTTERLPRAEEISRLKRQLMAQQKLMKDTMSHLSVSNRAKESIEDAVVNNLMEHEANLVRAHRNLEAKRANGKSNSHQSH